MTAPCLRLDDYLDGRLSAANAEAFETHTLACPACDAALDQAAPDLSVLRDVSCPPEVLEAALRTARRAPALAPDRLPARRHRPRRRFVVVPLALAAAVAIAVGVTWDRALDDSAPAIAEAVPPAAAAPEAPSALPEPTPPASDATAAPEPVAPAPRPEPTPAPRPTPPAPELTAPADDDLVAQTGATTDPAEPEPTPEEIEAARDDLALAFHLVAEAQARAREAVRDEATPLTHTLDRALPF